MISYHLLSYSVTSSGQTLIERVIAFIMKVYSLFADFMILNSISISLYLASLNFASIFITQISLFSIPDSCSILITYLMFISISDNLFFYSHIVIKFCLFPFGSVQLNPDCNQM